MPNNNINSEGIRTLIIRAYFKNKKVADDDTLLLSEVWKMSGWDKNNTLLANLRAMPSPETITRTRRKLITEGLLEASVSATERRYKNFKKTRRELGYEL